MASRRFRNRWFQALGVPLVCLLALAVVIEARLASLTGRLGAFGEFAHASQVVERALVGVKDSAEP
jgi:hypothetical protein